MNMDAMFIFFLARWYKEPIREDNKTKDYLHQLIEDNGTILLVRNRRRKEKKILYLVFR